VSIQGENTADCDGRPAYIQLDDAIASLERVNDRLSKLLSDMTTPADPNMLKANADSEVAPVPDYEVTLGNVLCHGPQRIHDFSDSAIMLIEEIRNITLK
jgi:hypothetical protein